MPQMKGLLSVVLQLREQRTKLVGDLKRVDSALLVLNGVDGGKVLAGPRRTLSAAGRKRIAAAQKLRWAKVRAHNSSPISKSAKPVKRIMSASARRKIAAAQRARWAKLKRAA
jgi:hypothetical protein